VLTVNIIVNITVIENEINLYK